MAFKRFWVSGLLSVAGLCCLLLISSSASAATLNVVGGELLGASGVIVDGSPYNVEFLDGTCIDLYDGCDDVSDFTFQSSAAALLASQALLDQVFLDGDSGLFDTVPKLTVGCLHLTQCNTWSPYALAGGGWDGSGAANRDGVDIDDITSAFGVDVGTDFSGQRANVFALWTLIPEPGTALLMGLGLLGLSASKRRKV